MRFMCIRALTALLLVGFALSAAAAVFPRFDSLEQQLKLKPDQKVQFDAAVASTQRALLSVALNALQVKEQVFNELAKPRPDLEVLARAHEAAIEQSRPLFKEAGDEWKRLFEMLDERQLAIARDFLRDNLDKLFAQIDATRR